MRAGRSAVGRRRDPDDDGELHEQCEEAEQEDERAASSPCSIGDIVPDDSAEK